MTSIALEERATGLAAKLSRHLGQRLGDRNGGGGMASSSGPVSCWASDWFCSSCMGCRPSHACSAGPRLCPAHHHYGSHRSGRRHHQPAQHHVDAGCRVPGFRDAGGFHHARSGLLPLARKPSTSWSSASSDTCLCGLFFYAFGYAFMFSHGNGFIGYHWFFLQDAPATYEATGVALLAHWIFPVCFCRHLLDDHHLRRDDWPHRLYSGDILYSFSPSPGLFIQSSATGPGGRMGFLSTMGSSGFFLSSLGVSFHDFAGSTVVHTIGGFVALAGSIVLGPRLGRKVQA